jgi:alanine dehydrogenase
MSGEDTTGTARLAAAMEAEVARLRREVERLRVERDVYRAWARATATVYPFPRTLHERVLKLLRESKD